MTVAGEPTHSVNVADQPAFSGPIVISGGTLRATGPQALGTTAGITTILNGGTLDVNNFDLGAEEIRVIGAGVFGNGAIVNNGGGPVLNLHRVILTGDTSFGGSGRWDIRNGGIAGEILDLAGFKLTKVGGNQVSLVNVNSTAAFTFLSNGV